MSWAKQRWLVFRLGIHFGVFLFVLISLVTCYPHIGGVVSAFGSGELVETVTHGEIARRLEALEAIGIERRLTALEVKVSANTTMLWAALAGLAALVAETFGRIFSVLVRFRVT